MKSKTFCIVLLSMMGSFSLESPAQVWRGRWGVGLGVRSQGLYPGSRLQSMRLGHGADGALSYRLSNRLGLALTAGYDRLPFTLDDNATGESEFRTRLFFGDLRLELELWKGFFRPYVAAGLGILKFDVVGDSVDARGATNGALGGSGGVRLVFGRKAIIDFGANYHHAIAADLDGGLRGGTTDGFLTFRSGVTWLFGDPLFERVSAADLSPSAPADALHINAVPFSSVSRGGEPRAESLSQVDAAFDSLSSNHLAFQNRPLSEAEIGEMVQRPLILDDCIRIALRKNIPLRLARAELTKAEASLFGSTGKFLPILTLSGTQQNTLQKRPFDALAPNDPRKLSFYNSFLTGSIAQFLPTGAVLDFTGDVRRDINSPDRFDARPIRTQNFAYTISLTQPLLRGAWSKVARSPIILAQHDRQIQEQQLSETKFNTALSVKQAYFEALRERELIKVNQAAIQRDSALVAASESMMQAKVATRRDILSAQIRLAEDRAELIKSETQYELALDALKEVLGLPLEKPIELAETELTLSAVELDEEALTRLALEHNPSKHMAEIAIRRARQVLTVEKNSLLPRLDLAVSQSGQLDTDTDQNRDLWTTGLQASINLSYPLLNREAVANAENAQIAVTQQEDRLTNLQRQIVLGVRNIVRRVRSIAEELNALEGSIAAAREKVSFATAMFRMGRASNLDITDAQEALLKAQQQRVSKLVDYHTELALLESLTGRPLSQ